MTEQELEVAILENMKDIYKADYIGKLKVTKYEKGFLVQLGLGTPEVPINIYTELDNDALIKFLRKELRDRRLSPRNFGYISLVYPTTCNPINRKCCDTRSTNR